MGAEGIRIEDFTRSLHNSPIKAYIVYDGSNRIIETYEAPTQTKEGQTCLLTTTAYVGATTNVWKFREELSLWPAGADI